MSVSVQIVKDSHGIPFTCSRSESIKAYNAAIMKFLHLTDWTGDGDGLLSEALKFDKYFFMGYIYIGTNLVRGMDLSPKNDSRIQSIINTCTQLTSTIKNLQQNELLYFKAFKHLFKGELKNALKTWKQIIELNSFDVLALLYLHYGYMAYGQIQGVLNSISCVISDFEKYKPHTLPYIHGLYGMALEENYNYSKAWKYIHLSLKANPYIVTASHAKVHTLQEIGHNVGCIQFLNDNEIFWRNNQKMHHVEWHWMVSYIDLGKYRNALDLFDISYLNKNKSKIKDTIRLRDAASFLWRLEMNSYDFNDIEMEKDIKYRWGLLKKFIQPELNERFISIYHDEYYLMNLIKNDAKLAKVYVEKFRNISEKHMEMDSENTYLIEKGPRVAVPIFESLYNGYILNEYNKAFDCMYDTIINDNNLYMVAGSRAQKEIFPLTMIDLGFKAGRYNTVKCLLNQRLEVKNILCSGALNLMSKLYKNHYNDEKTANIYQRMRVKVIDQQHNTLIGKSFDDFNTFVIDCDSKL
eukprot:46247_1